jgi:hypothetical protein
MMHDARSGQKTGDRGRESEEHGIEADNRFIIPLFSILAFFETPAIL